MASLRIDYDASSIEAVLTTDRPDRHWDIIVRTLREQTEDASLVGAAELRVPWWAFVATRRAIAYQVTTADISTAFGEDARRLLTRANEREQLLSQASATSSLQDEEIATALSNGGFVRPLKWFQERNLRSLCRLPVGATFSVPGAGKTTEALAFFTFFRQPDSRLLVVAPKNAFAAWEEQASICLKADVAFVRLRGGRAAINRALSLKPSLMLITYEQFPSVATALARYLSGPDSFLFLDESHRIKGGEAKVRANAILRVAPVATYKLLLSGTPLPNSQDDLTPQLKFIASELELTSDGPVDQIRPFFVRTTKSDLDLPAPSRVLVSVPMNEEQRRLYNLLRSEMARELEPSLARGNRYALRKIGRSAVRLLQYVSNPALLAGKLPEFDDLLGDVLEEGDSPKLQWVSRRARQLARQGQKVIIWSSFVENVELLAERLGDLGADYIHGGVEAGSDAEEDTREAKIKRFHDDPYASVLVANPAACGEGISLHTVCHHAIYVDRNYNAAQYLQSEDRIHRIGSDAQKYVEIVVCPESVDSSVARRLSAKIDRMADALDDPELRISPVPVDAERLDLDADDVVDLLGHLRTDEAA
jgi:SNF2 family DNA or RNA helicase